MHIKKLIQSLLLVAASVTVASAQNGDFRPIALEEALSLARQNNHQARIARSQVDQARGKNVESWRGFLPHVSISENYMRSNDPVNVFMMKLKQGIFTQQDFDIRALNDPAELDNFTTSFQVEQPILNFDAIYGKSAAGLGVKASQEAARRAQETVALHVKKAYYGLILARERVNTLDAAIRSAEAHRDNAKLAYEQGLVTHADYLTAEVRLAELREQRITAHHDVANASDMLRFMTGIQQPVMLSPTDSLALPAVTLSEAEGTPAITKRADLRALRFQTRAARRSLWMQRSGWFPRLNAFGAIEWNAASAFSDDATSWVVGLQLEWKLFDGLGHFGRAKAASAQRQIASVRLQQAEEQAQLEVRKAQRAVKAARDRIEVAEKARQQAREALTMTEARFEQGLEKTADLLDREAAFTGAGLRLLKARHDYIIAVNELEYAAGESKDKR